MSKAGVEALVHLQVGEQQIPVDGMPGWVGNDRDSWMDRLGHGALGVGERADADPGEQRRAERGGLADRRHRDRQAEHVGLDLVPQGTAGLAVDHRDLRLDAGPETKDLECRRVLEGDSLEYRSGEVAGRVPGAQPEEDPGRVRQIVRRPLAGDVGEEAQLVGARLDRVGERGQRVEAVILAVRRGLVAEDVPSATAARCRCRRSWRPAGAYWALGAWSSHSALSDPACTEP